MQAESLLCRHHSEALLREWVVQADGEMAVALVEEALHAFLYADGRDRDAFRAPCPTIGSREQLRGFQHGVQIVHRLALSHEDNVGESFAARHGIDLVQDIRGGEVASEALSACHAETASHAASHLTADAKRGSVVVWNEDTFHLSAAFGREEVLCCPVDALLYVRWRYASDGVALLQGCPVLEREVGHLVDAPDVFAVEPFGHLLCGKSRQSDFRAHSLQLVERHSEQLLLFHFAHFILQMYYILCKMKA